MKDLSFVVNGISGELQSVSGIGRASPDSIHHPKRSTPQERENRFFRRVISVQVRHPKSLPAVDLKTVDQWWRLSRLLDVSGWMRIVELKVDQQYEIQRDYDP